MSLGDAFAEYEAHYKEEVMRQTWGHLAPKRNKRYKGRVVFAVGCFSSDYLNPTPIVCEFKDLESSPWFYSALNEYLQSLKVEEGKVYEFTGKFCNYKFEGEVRTVFDPSFAKKFPKVKARRPLYESEPQGYLESDNDYMLNNRDAVIWFLENADKLKY
jgi:hypothetical protein